MTQDAKSTTVDTLYRKIQHLLCTLLTAAEPLSNDQSEFDCVDRACRCLLSKDIVQQNKSCMLQAEIHREGL